MTATSEAVFKPAKPTRNLKAQITDDAARAILDAEVSARETKTRALRELRLLQEASQADAEPAPAKKRRKAAPKTRISRQR
ncbi:MAG: hypothetical protein ACYC10_07640 [Allorhizobium sp.]